MTEFLMLAFIFLVAGVAAVPIASRLGLGSVLGHFDQPAAVSPACRRDLHPALRRVWRRDDAIPRGARVRAAPAVVDAP